MLADAPPKDAARPLISAKHATAVAYVASLFVSAMDSHIVNVMLPTLSRDFHAPFQQVSWTAIGYVLSLAIFIPASGFFGDRFGSKRSFLVAFGIFTIASAACGLASNLGELVAFRVLQGIGGGLLTPVATTMLYRAYPPEERARVTRVLVAPILLGPILAQPIGGLLVTKASWRFAFYLNVPIGVIVIALSARYLIEHRQHAERRFDAIGFVLSGGGLAALLYAISEGSLKGWGSVDIIAAGLGGVIGLFLFVVYERRCASPLLDLRLWHNKLFRATNAVGLANTAAFSGMLYLAPIFLQQARGLNALDAGLTSFSTAIGVTIASQTIGRIYPRVGPRRMAAIGQFLLATVLVMFLLVGAHTGLWWVRALLFCAGCSNSGTMLALQTSMFATVAPAETSFGSALFNAGRQSSTAIGIAIFTTTVASVGGGPLREFHAAFLVAAALALLAGVLALRLIDDEAAAATLRR